MNKIMKTIQSKMYQKTADMLLIVGGINWALVLFDLDLASLTPSVPVLSKVVYGVVGAAAVVKILQKK